MIWPACLEQKERDFIEGIRACVKLDRDQGAERFLMEIVEKLLAEVMRRDINDAPVTPPACEHRWTMPPTAATGIPYCTKCGLTAYPGQVIELSP